MRSGGTSRACGSNELSPTKLVCIWQCRFYIGCPAFPGISPTMWEFPQCLPMVLSCMNFRLGGTTRDGGFHLDNHALATNLLSHKLVCIHGGAGSVRASPSRVASPAGSVAPHSSMSSLARSRSRTPPHRTSLVRPCSHSVSSTSFCAAAPGSPAGSTGEGHEDSKSTSQDGSETDDKSMASSDDEAPGDDEHQASEGSDAANSSSDVKEAERSGSEVEGSTSQGSQSSSESNGEMPVHAAMPSKETGKTTATKKPRQVLLAPPSHPHPTLTARSLKQNRSVSNARMPNV